MKQKQLRYTNEPFFLDKNGRLSRSEIRRAFENVKVRITENPREYDQGSFCGSACCVAGHLFIEVFGENAYLRAVLINDTTDTVYDAVATAIATPDKFPWVFGTELESGPKDIRKQFRAAKSKAAKAAVACDAIDAYLKERKL